ncbi:MAG: hypothetical protein DRP27_03540 [Thermotogae bacterium]|nr:MAG: hypothetical protein DRP27_03540 [Thermotogota bacterium]
MVLQPMPARSPGTQSMEQAITGSLADPVEPKINTGKPLQPPSLIQVQEEQPALLLLMPPLPILLAMWG